MKNFGRDHQRKNFNKPKESQTAQSQVALKQVDGDNKKEGTVRMKEPLKCWGCGEPHMMRDCPHRNIHMISREREATTVNDIARNIPTISAALENRQEEHQATMVEIEGKISELPITVLIDPGASLSYISPGIVEKCNLKPENF